jgi:cysteinyl-tRNA synthetase
MSFHVYNTLSRQQEELVPLEDHLVRMYTCGPTVYDYAHIGNFRAYIFEDLLRRYLKFRGFRVTQVMNLTDVDDKTIRGSRREELPLREYTKKYIDAFFEDIDTLRIERAEYYPAATDHIGNMIALIQTLMEKGYAYQSDDGSVYFSLEKFEDYGKLAHLDKEGLQAGARVSQDEYDKENVGDFALWKAWDEEDGDVSWPSPWGRGRPGWHIECSAMSMKYLGESFDVHTGGVDNIFPHHDDEIAQSEAATGKPFAKYWMHCAHLIVEGRKMSKSLGNFYTLRDLLEKGYSGREVRYVLISTHYRQALNFTFDALDGARTAIRRLDEFAARLKETAGDAASSEDLPSWGEDARSRFTEALDDDLNVSGALAAVFDMVRAGHKALDGGNVSQGQALSVLALLNEFDQVFFVLEAVDEVEIDDEVVSMMNLRQEARKRKDFEEADRLREELAARGWTVQDTPEGPKLKRL